MTVFFSLEILCNFEIHRYGTPDSVKPNLNRRFRCNKTILSCLMGMLFSLLHRCFLINHQSFQHTNPTGIILVPLLKQSRLSKITCTIEKSVTCHAGSHIRICNCLCPVRIKVIGNLSHYSSGGIETYHEGAWYQKRIWKEYSSSSRNVRHDYPAINEFKSVMQSQNDLLLAECST